MQDSPARRPRTAKAKFSTCLVVCKKCAKRQGLGPREACRALKRALKRGGAPGKARILTAGCLGPCPKRMLAVATPESLSRRRVFLLDPALPSEEVSGLAANLSGKG